MNWLQSRKLSLILLVLIFACKRGDNDIAGEIQPKVEELSSFYNEELILKTSTVYYDSVPTSNSYRLLVGQYIDNEFGKITCHAYTTLGYETFSSFGPNPVVDSVYLRIYYNDTYFTYKNRPNNYYFGTDFNTPQNYSIHRLRQNIHHNVNGDDDYPKYSHDLVDYEATPLATFDALSDSSYQTIFLDPKLGNEIIQNSDSLMTSTGFQNIFNGLAIIASPTNSIIRGIRSLELVIKYHNFYGLNNLKVKETFSFVSLQNTTKSFTQITVDKNSSRLNSLKNSYDTYFDASDAKCFIQSNTGIYTKVEFPTLRAFIDSFPNKKILITRADLIIKPSLEDTVNFSIPTRLFAYELKADGRIKKIIINSDSIAQTLQDQLAGNIFGNSSPLGASYSIGTKSYKFTITSYLQALIDGRKDNYGLLLGASNDVPSIQNIPFSYTVLSKMSFYNDKNRPSNISLKIYYSTY